MSTISPTATPASGTEYQDWIGSQRSRFMRILADHEGRLFQTDANDSANLWDAYLASIPAEHRQANTCHACRRFVEQFGGLVCISDTGAQVSPFWDPTTAPPELMEAVCQVRNRVEKAKVTSVFFSDKAELGTLNEGGFTHLSAKLPSTLVNLRKDKTAFQLSAAKSQDYVTIRRAIDEFQLPHLLSALQILKTASVDRSQQFVAHMEWLLALKETRHGAHRGNRLWLAVAKAPDGWCSPRAQVIGSLLEDLANGLTLESVTTRWNAKVNPLSYQRPQAAPSAGTVQQAEKLFETMGLADSLPRRFARLEEMEALWLPQGSSEPKEAGKGLFGDLATKQEAKASSRPVEPKAAPMTWEKFRKTVLPEALEMQVKTPGSRGNYVAFTAPVNGWAPPLLRWDSDNHRNPIGWYIYHGGSPTSGWALPVSEWVDVTTVCLLASAWGGRPSTDSSVTFLLKGCRDTRAKGIGSALFPETMRAELHGVRAVVEAYSKKHDLEPSGGEDACGLTFDGPGTSISVRVRSRLGWAVYTLDRLD